MVAISIITGDAGTGKSYVLAKYINSIEQQHKKYCVLSFTHSAVNNIKNICKKEYKIDNDNFMTLHKYFRINIETNKISCYNFSNIDYMFIDEYSLISVTLFKTIFPIIYNTVAKLVLVGDYKQLRAIDSSNTIDIEFLEKYINDNGNIDKNNISSIKQFNSSILSLDHIERNIISFVKLMENKRSNTTIQKLINTICFDKDININDLAKIIKERLITNNDMIRYIANDDYVFIASKYEYLQKVHMDVENYIPIMHNGNNIEKYKIINKLNSEKCSPNLNKLELKENSLVTVTENTKELINGESYIFKEYNDKNNYIILESNNETYYLYRITNDDKESYFPIIPSYVTTFHKSQGKSINNIIICLDSLFDFTMLYTGMSRARENIYFYIFDNKNIDSIIENNIYPIRYKYDHLNKIISYKYPSIVNR